jgi:hypothetical protein
MKKTNIIIFSVFALFAIFACFAFLIPEAAAQYTYPIMEKIPGFDSDMTDFPHYVLAFTKFGIWTVGIVALFMITFGGFMYMTSAGNTSRMDSAKTVIFDAFFGLIVALAAWLLLFVINPDLVKVNLAFKPVLAPTPSLPSHSAYAPIVPPGPAGTCQGLPTQLGIASQCGDVSPTLSGLLACLAGKLPTATLSSISDSAGYATCKYTWNRPPCAHGSVSAGCIPGGACHSCHYGGKTCTDGSYAADISTSNLSGSAITAAAAACGAHYIKNEGNHIHISVGSACGCY